MSQINQLSLTLENPIKADIPITHASVRVECDIPPDAAFKTELTNNANDPTPIWEDATAAVLGGHIHVFANRPVTGNYAFNLRITAKSGISGQTCSIGEIKVEMMGTITAKTLLDTLRGGLGFDQIADEIEAQGSTITVHTNTLTTHASALSGIETRVGTSEGDITAIKTDLANKAGKTHAHAMSDITSLNTTITTMQTNITAAQSAASTAQTTANTAKTTADTAKTTATTAQTTADSAKTTATTAQTTADSAKTTATTAQTTADSAKTTATTAQTTANTAKTTADTAKTAAATAQTTADSAKSTATAAQTAANTAQTTANTAKTTADTAQTTANSKVKMTLLTATLSASAWNANGELTLSNASIPAKTNTSGEIRAPQTISMDVLEALEAARPWVISQSAGSIKIKARGTVPTVNIPIEIEVRV